MTDPTTPNLAEDLVSIHAIITRALNVAGEKGRLFGRGGYPDASVHRGFVAYAETLVSVLHSHHLTESDLFFPYFREKMPDAPFTRAMPPVVTRLLLPLVWRRKWAPMRPFLLP